MTVITKSLSENKGEKPPLEKPLVGLDSVETGCGNLGLESAYPRQPLHPHHDEVDVWSWAGGSTARKRRVSATTTVCAFVATLLMLTAAIIGGVYLYRQLTHNQMSRFRGWCGVPFNRNSIRMHGHHPISLLQTTRSRWPPGAHPSLRDSFNEQFDLDLSNNEHEEIYVPDFGVGRDGHFIHDFGVNLTAIVDTDGKRCYVIPLDRRQVANPLNLFSILDKMWHGFHEGNMLVVRQSLRVVRPPLKDLSEIGFYISSHCSKFTTYRLEKITKIHGIRIKRSADDSAYKAVEDEEMMIAPKALPVAAANLDSFSALRTSPDPGEQQQQEEQKQQEGTFIVAEFAGNDIVEYTILDE